MIEQPYTIKSTHTVDDANKSMNEYGISGLLVVDGKKKLVGIITRRDITFEKDTSRKVSELMSKDVVTANEGITTNQGKEILHEHRVEKLPVVDDRKTIVGLITSKDILKMDKYPYASKDKKGRLLVGAAVGVKGDFLERAESLLKLVRTHLLSILLTVIAIMLSMQHMIKKAFPMCEHWECCYWGRCKGSN